MNDEPRNVRRGIDIAVELLDHSKSREQELILINVPN